MEAQSSPHIVLYVGDDHEDAVTAHLNVDAEGVLTVGKGEHNDLVAGGEFASGDHAYLESHRDDFYLVDCSTNGTFVQTEDEHVQYVHRARVRLWGSGWISLGQPLHEARPILLQEVIAR